MLEIPCSDCRGSGYQLNSDQRKECPVCGGKGWYPRLVIGDK